MRISQAMAGKTKDDLNAETMKLEKAKMLDEERRKMTVIDNFEKSDSEYSTNIDRVMKIRSMDPKEMKSLDPKAKETKKKEVQRSERSDLENKEYFRQNETKYQETALIAQK